MEDRLIMSKRELERKTLLDGHRYKKLTLLEVGKRLGLSYRQTKRIWSKYKLEGDSGLCHQNRGKTPKIAYEVAHRNKILELYQAKYMGFGPTYACEKLIEDDGIHLNAETLRLWLKREGLWKMDRKRNPYRKKRERRPNFGDLLQIDGSIHKWFDGQDEHYCLLNMVDDATGITLAKLDTGETTKILLETFWEWVRKYGIPKAVYVDLKSVYVSPKSNLDRSPENPNGYSVFERVCLALGVEIIKAYSPQAKGRVERKHRVFQDRLVKDIKLYNLETIEAVNLHLENKFLDKINEKFADKSESIKDSHRNPEPYGDLNQIFCWTYKRCLKNDWTLRFKGYYQIHKEAFEWVKPGQPITIREYLDGQTRFWHEGKELPYSQLITKPAPLPKPVPIPLPRRAYDPALLSKRATENRHKSPWGNQNHACFTTPKNLKKAS